MRTCTGACAVYSKPRVATTTPCSYYHNVEWRRKCIRPARFLNGLTGRPRPDNMLSGLGFRRLCDLSNVTFSSGVWIMDRRRFLKRTLGVVATATAAPAAVHASTPMHDALIETPTTLTPVSALARALPPDTDLSHASEPMGVTLYTWYDGGDTCSPSKWICHSHQ